MALTIPKLEKVGNVAFEGFSVTEMNTARAANLECKRGSDLAVGVVQSALTLDAIGPKNKQRILTWFGIGPGSPAHEALYRTLRQNLLALQHALLVKPLTIVYRPSIVLKHAPHDRNEPRTDVLFGDGTLFSGAIVYGYAHHHVAGSGFRIVCGRPFITDPTPYYASTTIYHELTHKVFASQDLAYGDVRCKDLALTSPADAINNADSYAYFVISLFTKNIN